MSYLTIVAMLAVWVTAFMVVCELYDQWRSGERWRMFE